MDKEAAGIPQTWVTHFKEELESSVGNLKVIELNKFRSVV